MHRIELSSRGDPHEFSAELILCSSNAIEQQKLPSYFSCLLLGVPNVMNVEEFEVFIEPFKSEYQNYELISEDQSTYVSTVEARCKIALINFHNESSYDTFCSLYNNLHFPSYRTNPPCLTMPITIEKVDSSTQVDSDQLKVAKLDPDEAINKNTIISSTPSNRTRRLPLCTVCLRRIKSSVSQISGSNDIPVHTKFAGNGVRCLVCRIYGGTQSVEFDELNSGSGDRKQSSSSRHDQTNSINVATDVTKLRRCLTCDLRDNIWVCMICAHTGCGRYTCQHAQHHYEQSGHPFSLELASGRIWDYDHDTFVHVERGPLEDILHSSRRRGPVDMQYDGDGLSASPRELHAADGCTGKSVELSQPNTARSDSDVGTPREKSEWFRLRSASFEEMSRTQAIHGLGTDVRNKIDAIVERYERLLETQLRQQQQYYEKLLSRETSRAFYASLSYGTIDIASSHGGTPSVDTNVSSVAKVVDEDKGKSESDEVTVDWAMAGGLTEEDLNDIITAKLEISSIEYDSTLLLEKLRDVELKTKRAQRQNDQLVKKRRQHLEKIESLRQLTKDRQGMFEETVTDLEQQIRDLSFYARTQAQLARSPIRTELEGGQVVGVVPAQMNSAQQGGAHTVAGTQISSTDPLSVPTSSSSATASRLQRSSSDGKKKKSSKTPR